MKLKYFLTVVLLLLFSVSFAQNNNDLWPIKDAKPGDGIIYKPQDYVENVKNTEFIFITAPEGTLILAPKDGIVRNMSYGYTTSANSGIGFRSDKFPKKEVVEFDINHRKHLAETEKNIKAQFISLHITISCGNGESYSIDGIRPVKFFEEGEKVKKGDVIGKVGYCYEKINKPCISLAHGLYGKQADPMTPFGLKTTFIPFKTKHDYNAKIPVKELLIDFNILTESLEEGYPGLYDYISKENFTETFNQALKKINTPMTSEEFRQLIYPIVDSLRDSHMRLNSIVRSGNNANLDKYAGMPIRFGLQNDSLIIFQVMPIYKDLLGKCIVEINGVKSDDIIKITKIPSSGNDGFITSGKDFNYFRMFFAFWMNNSKQNIGDTINFKFSDNQKATITYIPLSQVKGFIPVRPKQADNAENFEAKKINSKTAYINIRTFFLTNFDLDSISNFIHHISTSGVENLIFDVRGNYGGEGTYGDLFAMIAQKPFKTGTLSMVCKNGKYNFFKNCSNLIPNTALFSDFKSIEGKTGYYSLYTDTILPNDSSHFGGNVYVLTDHNSLSASTIFAAIVHKYKRGLIIGRETGSCYYQMNAVKFANIFLQNTSLELTIPLVKVVFDSEIDKSIPWGRGVIPDYAVNLSYDEFFGINDRTLQFTLELIEKRKD
jgi:hypothetical protein